MAESEEEDTKDTREVAFSDRHEEYSDRLAFSERSNGEEMSHHEHHDEVGPMETDIDIELGHSRSRTLTSLPSFKDGKYVRESFVTDLSTGKKGGARAQNALKRSSSSCSAQDPGHRRRHSLLRHLAGASSPSGGVRQKRSDDNEEEDGLRTSMHGRFMVSTHGLRKDDDIENGESQPIQYRLQAIRPATTGSRLLRLMGMSDGQLSIFENSGAKGPSSCFGFSPNNLVIRYLHWSFRSSFMAVFLSAACGFLTLTIFFALIIWSIGRNHPTCIGGVDFENDYFTDAFVLSWTTFSTVGYGLIYSGISADEPNISKCTGITIVVTLEAFVGVLFASMCGAVMFAKVARIQSFAQVLFSDPVVIRYGAGVVEEGQEEKSDDGSSSFEIENIPCPILEFRIVNQLNSIIGGEIIDATVNLVASIDASQACRTVRHAVNRRRRGKKGKKGGLRSRGSIRRVPSGSRRDESASLGELNRTESTDSLRALASNVPIKTPGRTHQAFEEDPTGRLVPRRIFSKLEVESPDHPFFKRVWAIRHRLDENSPLLKTHARQLVKLNHGHWPRELNNAEGVRAAVLFDQILVSMSGTSNADANAVYAQKVYDFVDLNVGYRFVNVLYRDPNDDSLRVDSRLINDVMEQAGGGGEPFLRGNEDKLQDMLVL